MDRCDYTPRETLSFSLRSVRRQSWKFHDGNPRCHCFNLQTIQKASRSRSRSRGKSRSRSRSRSKDRKRDRRDSRSPDRRCSRACGHAPHLNPRSAEFGGPDIISKFPQRIVHSRATFLLRGTRVLFYRPSLPLPAETRETASVNTMTGTAAGAATIAATIAATTADTTVMSATGTAAAARRTLGG